MMMKKILIFGLAILAVSCVTPVEEDDSLVLTELAPQKKEVVETKTVNNDPVYITGRIAEIEEVGGAQKFVYVKFSDTDPSIRNGSKGEIFADQTLASKVGNISIIEKYPGYYYAEILDLIYTIDRNAVVRIQIK